MNDALCLVLMHMTKTEREKVAGRLIATHNGLISGLTGLSPAELKAEREKAKHFVDAINRQHASTYCRPLIDLASDWTMTVNTTNGGWE